MILIKDYRLTNEFLDVLVDEVAKDYIKKVQSGITFENRTQIADYLLYSTISVILEQDPIDGMLGYEGEFVLRDLDRVVNSFNNILPEELKLNASTIISTRNRIERNLGILHATVKVPKERAMKYKLPSKDEFQRYTAYMNGDTSVIIDPIDELDELTLPEPLFKSDCIKAFFGYTEPGNSGIIYFTDNLCIALGKGQHSIYPVFLKTDNTPEPMYISNLDNKLIAIANMFSNEIGRYQKMEIELNWGYISEVSPEIFKSAKDYAQLALKFDEMNHEFQRGVFFEIAPFAALEFVRYISDCISERAEFTGYTTKTLIKVAKEQGLNYIE
jgi:hypothetical protein